MAAGSISWDEFNDLAHRLADFSAKINDSWQVLQSPANGGQVYLEKKTLLPDSVQNQGGDLDACGTDDEPWQTNDKSDSEECDLSCATVLPETDHLFLMYHFHVLYSHSYSVPVLYFNVYQPGGQRLRLEELWAKVPSQYQYRMQDKWATLSQQEHPLLGTPFFMLHPCNTSSLMSQVPGAHDKRYYLIKWLSSVGPVVGLEMSPKYATAFEDVDIT